MIPWTTQLEVTQKGRCQQVNQQEHQYGTQGKQPGQTAFGTGHWSGVFFAILEHGVINVFLEVRLVVAAAYHQHVIGINHQEV